MSNLVGRVGVIKIVIVINCNLITFFKIIENNCNLALTLITIHFRPVITRWSGSTSRMCVIGEARNANLLSQTRLIAVSVVYWWVGNLYDVCIGLTELGGLSQSPCKME